MKFLRLASLTIVTTGVSQVEKSERKYVDAKICKRRSPFELTNGQLNCSEKNCKVKCDSGYDLYGGTKTIRCKQYSKPGPDWPQPTIDWNKEAGRCETCVDMPLDSRFYIDCDFINKLGQKIHRCKIRCVNKQDIQIGNKVQKKMLITKCRCSRQDNDGRCHWRLGEDYVDRDFSQKTFSKWNCGEIQTTVLPTTNTPAMIPNDLVCPESAVNGNRKVRVTDADRIIGGMQVDKNSWPWIARLRITTNQGALLCGGTLIDDESILTTALCCQHGTRIQAFIGDHYRTQTDNTEQVFDAKNVIIHPEFNSESLENDVCLVKMPKMNLSSNSNAAPACLPSPGDHPQADSICWTAGWGKNQSSKTGSSLADALNSVDVKILSDQQCKGSNVGSIISSDKMFCAGWLEGGKDACHGDSGGPLICAEGGKPVLYGMISWGVGCAQENTPGVYVKVTNYVSWIDSL